MSTAQLLAQASRAKVAPLPITQPDMSTSLSPRDKKPTTQAGQAGAVMIAKRFEKDRTKKELTKREEDGAVGDWLFGKGGIRGLGYDPLPERAMLGASVTPS